MLKVKIIDITEDAALKCEQAARMCYDSADKTCQGSAKKLLNAVVNKGHYSVLEFADVTFEVTGVSRALLAQITRHRHLSFNVRSQRYVKENDPQYITPPNLTKEQADIFLMAMGNAWNCYKALVESGVRAEDARFVLPNACETRFHVRGNIRAWKEWLAIRTDRAAQWEIRNLALEIEKQLKETIPEVFF